MMTVSRTTEVTAAVNELFADVNEGFINAHSEPSMTTPFAIAEIVVTGSTICLIC